MLTENLDPFTMDENEFSTDEEKNRNELMKQASMLIKAHNDLMSQIGVENLVGKISELINGSDKIQFRSKYASQVDLEVPVFIMSIVDDVHGGLSDMDSSKYESRALDIIQEEIIKPTGIILNEFIEDNSDYFDNFEERYGVDSKTMFMSNIFGVTISNYQDNNIQLRVII